jgi:hypothetical protein
VHDGALHVSHTLCPHEVLRCGEFAADPDIARITCAVAYKSTSTAQFPSKCNASLRGGSQPVQIGNFRVGTAHSTRYLSRKAMIAKNFTSVDREYLHHFYLADAAPPFTVRRVSSPFVFPRLFDSEVDSIQFSSGLALLPDSRGGASQSASPNLLVTYGVGDCAAMQVTLPLSRVLSALNASDLVRDEKLWENRLRASAGGKEGASPSRSVGPRSHHIMSREKPLSSDLAARPGSIKATAKLPESQYLMVDLQGQKEKLQRAQLLQEIRQRLV